MKMLLLIILFVFNSVKIDNTIPTEAQKIQLLITYVEQLKGVTFIRNGDEHSAKDAAKFFRKKFDRKKAEIKTARDFISKCASVSTTSGKPYQIKFADGKVMTTEEVLNKELVRIESCIK